ncbi:MarR family winged helix-turn-helix transcriptional regulator [Roseibium algae]|uniref:MarR family winged helix-turn-helix transcriptional regulator n=1 Tax=Roseibium algae TaxID=3123038 RepID=A0ABU8TJG3_9HYPH
MTEESNQAARQTPERDAALALERLAVEFAQFRPSNARAHGLTTQYAIIMAVIYDHPGCGVSAITEQTGMFQSTVSRSLASLYKKGIVRRETSVTDTRAVELHLTAEGTSILETIRDEWRIRVAAMLDAVQETDRTDLLKGLGVLSGVIHHLTQSSDVAAAVAEDL